MAKPKLVTGLFKNRVAAEAAVDAIALEVERISESQRFTARLQSEQASPRLPGRGGSSGQ